MGPDEFETPAEFYNSLKQFMPERYNGAMKELMSKRVLISMASSACKSNEVRNEFNEITISKSHDGDRRAAISCKRYRYASTEFAEVGMQNQD